MNVAVDVKDQVTVTAEGTLDLEAAYRVAHFKAGVRLSDEARARCAQSHQTLRRAIEDKRHIYGITTGFGPLANRLIDAADGVTLQQNLVHHLATGVGQPLPWATARAVMLARLASIARGYSGASSATIDALLAVLNSPFAPALPERGTVGASGDLTPLAHMVLALQGRGSFLGPDDVELPAADALRSIGLSPLTLAHRDGLALVNGTSAMTGIATITAVETQHLVDWALRLTAALGEVMGARSEAWAQIFATLRTHAGQVEATEKLRKYTEGSARLKGPPIASRSVTPTNFGAGSDATQDAYTLRCAPQVIGACLDALTWHASVVRCELNSVSDNPVFTQGDVPAWHGGNFMGQPVALVSDSLTTALTVLAGLAERQIARITDETLNRGLPAFLHGGDVGLNSGFMGAQVTATAIVAEMRTRGSASVQSISTNGANQDVVSMGTIAARHSSHARTDLSEVLAILALIVARGMDLTGDRSAYSGSARQLLDYVRSISAPLTQDRPLSADICAVAKCLREYAPAP